VKTFLGKAASTPPRIAFFTAFLLLASFCLIKLLLLLLTLTLTETPVIDEHSSYNENYQKVLYSQGYGGWTYHFNESQVSYKYRVHNVEFTGTVATQLLYYPNLNYSAEKNCYYSEIIPIFSVLHKGTTTEFIESVFTLLLGFVSLLVFYRKIRHQKH
jgi:hypothetical protein